MNGREGVWSSGRRTVAVEIGLAARRISYLHVKQKHYHECYDILHIWLPCQGEECIETESC